MALEQAAATAPRALTGPASSAREGLLVSAGPSRWILHPWLDVLLLALPWLPVFLVATLVLGEQQIASPVLEEAQLFLLVLFAANFTHRNYTYLLVFGDRRTFRERPLTFVAVFAVAFGVSALASFGALPGLMPLLVVVIAAWNLQHVVMQRYGFLRVYARRQGGEVASEAHGRRDLWLIWSWIGAVFAAWLFADDPYYGYFEARVLSLELGTPTGLVPRLFELLPWVAALAAAPVFAWSLWRWVRHELASEASLRDRTPRWIFLAASLPLYAIAVSHDIYLAFLCVMAAHAIEYVAFVHVHWRRRYRGRDRRDGWAVPLLRSSLASFLLLGLGGALLYALELSQYPKTSGWVGFYLTGTVLVHFSCDGLIWRRGGPASRGGAFA